MPNKLLILSFIFTLFAGISSTTYANESNTNLEISENITNKSDHPPSALSQYGSKPHKKRILGKSQHGRQDLNTDKTDNYDWIPVDWYSSY